MAQEIILNLKIDDKGSIQQLSNMERAVYLLAERKKNIIKLEKEGSITSKEASDVLATLNLNLKKQQNALRDLNQDILKANDSTRKSTIFHELLGKSTDTATMSLGEMRQELIALKNTSFAGKSSEEITALKQRIGDLTDSMADSKAQAASMGTEFGSNLAGSLKFVSAGFEGIAGGMQLMGVDSKVLEPLQKNMMAMIATTQSLGEIQDVLEKRTLQVTAAKIKDMVVTKAKQIADWSSAVASNAQVAAEEAKVVVMAKGNLIVRAGTAIQWLWNAALAANPIGLVIAGVAALAGGLAFLYSSMNKNVEVTHNYERALDGTVIKNDELRESYNKHIVKIRELAIEYQLLTGVLNDQQAAMAKLNLEHEVERDEKFKENSKKIIDYIKEETHWYSVLSGMRGMATIKSKEQLAIEKNNQKEYVRLVKEQILEENLLKKQQEVDKKADDVKTAEDDKKEAINQRKDAVELRIKIFEDRQKLEKSQYELAGRSSYSLATLERDQAIALAIFLKENGKITILEFETLYNNALAKFKDFSEKEKEEFKKQKKEFENIAKEIIKPEKLTEITTATDKFRSDQTAAENKASQDRYDEIKRKEDNWQNYKKNIAFETLNFIYDAEMKAIENRYNREAQLIEQRKNKELSNKNLTEEQKTAIEKKYAKQLSDAKKKAWIKERNAAIIKANIDLGLAILRAFKDYGWPYNLIVAGIQAGMAGVQIANIANQPIPEFEKGGMVDGPSHSQGGVQAQVNGGGRIELQGKEFITNREATAQFLPLLQMINQTGLQNQNSAMKQSIEIQPVQAFITESDISRTQNRLSKIRQRSEL